MRLTIIAEDGTVYLNGARLKVDTSSLDPTIHAVQWYDTYGEVEFKTDAKGNRKPNMKITDVSPYQSFVDKWNTANAQLAADNAARAAAAAKAAAATPKKTASPATPVHVIAN